MDEQVALEPPEWDIGASGEVDIFNGEGEVIVRDVVYPASVRIWFSWEAGVRVHARGTGSMRLWVSNSFLDVEIVTAVLPPFTASVINSDVTMPEDLWVIDGSAATDAVATSGDVMHVDFQVANFTKTWGSDGLSLTDSSYRIELMPHPDVGERTDELKLSRRGATTYLGRLARADAVAMTWDEVTDLLTCLQFLLTFAAGDWSPVLLPTSFDDSGHRAGVGLRDPRREPYRGRLSWCTSFHLETLPALWRVFRDLWSQREMRQRLRLCLSLYVEAQHGDVLETRLVHAVSLLEALAGSTGRRNSLGELLCWGHETQGLARPPVEPFGNRVEGVLVVGREAGAAREVLAQQAHGVLCGALLPRCLRVAEVDGHAGVDGEVQVPGHLQPAVPRQRSAQLLGQRQDVPRQCVDDRCGLEPVGQLDEHHEPRRALDQQRDPGRLGAHHQVALPMARHRPVSSFGRPFGDGDRVGDLPAAVALEQVPVAG